MLIYFMRRYSQKPIHIFGTAGFIAFFTGVLINLYLLGLKILGQDIWGKPLLILGVILLIGGIQLVPIGILADIGLRTDYESIRKGIYKVRRVVQGGQDTVT